MRSRVLQVLLSPRIGGAETLVAALSASWSNAGTDVETVYLDADGDPRRFRARFDRWLRLRRAIRSFRPTVILAHSALPNLYSRLQLTRIPVICVLHSATDDFASRVLRLAERAVIPRTAMVVAVSAEQESRYRSHFGARVQTTVIPNGIAQGLPEKTDFPLKPHRIVEIARVASQKRPDLWVAAAAEFCRSDTTAVFSWWGPITSDLPEKFIPKTNGPVRFEGPTTEPGAALLASDAFFHCASREAHSIGILEAAAVGLPIVCSDTVALTLPRGLPAAVFRDGDEASAILALNQLADNYAAAVANAVTFTSIVRDDFGIAECRAAYDGVIMRVCN